ncbi:methylmalonyl-CoA epimerase [Natronoarchaeum sp. GCM10025703]|uniref:methylmalonyl-CoA epimerase n=1 Tax=unclassified Natronoarchaeum TaxID=2620183 RepID=UPI003617F656
MQFHHTGVATQDADQLIDLYGALFDAPVVHEEELDGLRIVMLEVDGGYFELLEPIQHATVARFLDKHGPGVHHVAVLTEDIEAALETARELEIECIDEEPREGAWGHDVAFLHPNDTGGVLVEFVEE